VTHVILHVAALVVYVAAGVLYGANLTLKAPAYVLRARILLVLGVLLHTAAIGMFCVDVKQSPFASSFGTLSIASWAVALVCLPVEFIGRVRSLGALAMPVAAILLFGGLVRSGRALSPAVPEIRTGMTSLHVLLILFSFALFALAACCAVFYVWQYGLLKHPDKRGLFRRLPPLETVDGLAYHLVAFALPLLTLGLSLGIVNAANGGLKGNWLADPHTIMSLGTWFVYMTYIAARTLGGWRGTRLNYLLIAGLAVTVALYFVPTSTHRFT
jgi:ABC-type uncharacterized transport system permease subunit